MLPDKWGRSGWNFVHYVTLGYPDNPTDEDKYHYYEFFHSLKNVLPCNKCGYNMSQHLKKYPLTDKVLANRQNLIRWGIDLHNVVNYYTGKPLLSYQEAFYEIEKSLNTSKKRNTNELFYYFLLLVGIVIVILLVFYYLIKKKN